MTYSGIAETDGVNISLEGFVPVENIGINMSLIQKLGAIGGFQSVEISSYSGQTGTFETEITDMTSNGAAFGRVTPIKSADSFKTNFSDLDKDFKHDKNYNVLKLRLNSTAIAQRVIERPENIHTPKPWAREVNMVVKQGLRSGVWDNILASPASGEIVPGLLLATIGQEIGKVLSDGYGAISSASASSLGAMVAVGVGLGIPKHFLKRSKEAPEGSNFSLFPVLHIDHAMAVSATTRCRRLVKTI